MYYWLYLGGGLLGAVDLLLLGQPGDGGPEGEGQLGPGSLPGLVSLQGPGSQPGNQPGPGSQPARARQSARHVDTG